MSPKPNTEFNYLYRDASNYKNHDSIVLTGPLDDPRLIERLKAALSDGLWFIAQQVDVPPVDFVSTGEFPQNEDDHSWHEFDSLEPTDAPATDPRTPAKFVAQLEKAKRDGWSVLRHGRF